MVRNRKVTGKAMSMPGGLLLGAGISIAILLACVIIMTVLTEREMLTWNKIGYCIMVMLILSTWAGTVVGCRVIKRRILAVGVMSGGLYYILVVGIAALLFGGEVEASGVTALLTMGTSIAAAIIEMREKTKGMHKKGRVKGLGNK